MLQFFLVLLLLTQCLARPPLSVEEVKRVEPADWTNQVSDHKLVPSFTEEKSPAFEYRQSAVKIRLDCRKEKHTLLSSIHSSYHCVIVVFSEGLSKRHFCGIYSCQGV